LLSDTTTTSGTTATSSSEVGASHQEPQDHHHRYRLRVHDAFIVRYDAEHDMSLSLPEHSDTSVISFTVALNQRGRDFQGGGTWFETIEFKENENNTDGSEDTNMTQQQQQQGGGSSVVDADEGHAVAFAGPLRHAGYPITSGCRMILVLFLYVQDFPYGHLLDAYKTEHKHKRQQKERDDGKVSSSAADVVANDCQTIQNNDNSKEPTICQTPTTRPSGDSPGGFVVYNQTVELVSMLNRRVASILDD
jgi:hypothetical protein